MTNAEKLKKYRSELRKLKKGYNESEYELECLEMEVDRIEYEMKELKAKIKSLTKPLKSK